MGAWWPPFTFVVHVLFPRPSLAIIHRVFLQRKCQDSQTSTSCSLFAAFVHSEWFINRSNHIHILTQILRGPAAILFISRDTFSDSIAKLFRACFPGVSHKYRAICCKMGYRTDMSVSNKAPRGGIAPCWGIAGMAEKVSRDRGYRSDTIAVSRDMGPLSSNHANSGH